MNKTTLKAFVALVLLIAITYWSYQYYENKVILNNYNLLIVIFLLFSLLILDNEKR